MPTRLNIGGGSAALEGFDLIDRSVGLEAYPLDFATDSVDEIRASHILEHFGHREKNDVLREWVRVLKPGGRIRISVPDIDKLARAILERAEGPVEGWLYGGQTDANDYHKSGWSREGLAITMRELGLVSIAEWDGDTDTSRHPISLNLEGYKPSVDLATVRKRVAGAMTVPTLGHQATFRCIAAMQADLGIELRQFTGGAYFDKGMEIAMRGVCASREYCLTIDYDSVFSSDDVLRLVTLLDTNPDVSAVAAMQLRRGDDVALHSGPKGGVEQELVDVRAAHFGLTLFRSADLLAVPGPWLAHQYDEEGYGPKQIDADVAFWLKLAEHGKRFCVAPGVRIGHLQQMVTWAGLDGTVQHQYVDDFFRNGKPQGVKL